MKLDYFLFMGEAEGIESITTTRQTRINAAIKDFIMMARKGYDINSDNIQAVILEDHHIQDISEKECKYIAREVERNIY
jgi:hypothetical protein